MATSKPCRPSTRQRCRPDTLVLSGGGVRGVATLGAVDRLRRAGMLSKVKMVVGTSAGALVGALVATRRDPLVAFERICTHGYKPDFDFDRLSKEFGLDNGECIEELLRALLATEDAVITFGQVRQKYGVTLVVCVTNITKRRAEYLGPDTHPDMPVTLAVRMSCSVPLYFGAVTHGGCWYVDGSIADNFPCDWAADNGAKYILGICTRPTCNNNISSFEAFMGAVVESAACSQGASRADVLDLSIPGASSLNFGADRSLLSEIFAVGVQHADTFVKKRV